MPLLLFGPLDHELLGFHVIDVLGVGRKLGQFNPVKLNNLLHEFFVRFGPLPFRGFIQIQGMGHLNLKGDSLFGGKKGLRRRDDPYIATSAIPSMAFARRSADSV